MDPLPDHYDAFITPAERMELEGIEYLMGEARQARARLITRLRVRRHRKLKSGGDL